MHLQVLGLLHWALIASAPYWSHPAYGWVLFVAVTLWLLTTILFFMILFSVQRKLPSIPWPLTVSKRDLLFILFNLFILAHTKKSAEEMCLTFLLLSYR